MHIFKSNLDKVIHLIVKVTLVLHVGGQGWTGYNFINGQNTNGAFVYCGRCGQYNLLYIRLYSDGGDVIGSKALCDRCGSVNYKQGRRGNTTCSTCSGHGYLLDMNCYNCSNGQANCKTCGGDWKDEL